MSLSMLQRQMKISFPKWQWPALESRSHWRYPQHQRPNNAWQMQLFTNQRQKKSRVGSRDKSRGLSTSRAIAPLRARALSEQLGTLLTHRPMDLQLTLVAWVPMRLLPFDDVKF